VRQGLEQETEKMPSLFRVIGDSRLPVNWIAAPRIWLVTCADFQRRDAGNILGAVVSQTHDYRQQVLADAWMQVELYVRRAGLNGDNPPLKLPPNRGIP
jgi:hypothetical protein